MAWKEETKTGATSTGTHESRQKILCFVHVAIAAAVIFQSYICCSHSFHVERAEASPPAKTNIASSSDSVIFSLVQHDVLRVDAVLVVNYEFAVCSD